MTEADVDDGKPKSKFIDKVQKDKKTRNSEFVSQTQKQGQTDVTEEILRKHYFIAKTSGKTTQPMLEKEMSPQKHMIKYQDGNIETVRGKALDDISKQAAAMMRLNSLWGLESKGE